MKDIKLLISTILIIISFFLWYYFASIKYETKINNLENKKYIVNIEKLKTKLNISHDDNVIIKIDWIENYENEIKID